MKWLACLGFLAATAPCWAGYDAANYFNNQNPNGPVRYSGGLLMGSSMTNYGSVAGDVSGGYNFWGYGAQPWSGPNPYSLVFKTWNTDKLVTSSGDVLPRNQLCMHPGLTSGQGMLSLTLPGTNLRAYVEYWRPSPLGDGGNTYILGGTTTNSNYAQAGPYALMNRQLASLDFAPFPVSRIDIAAWSLGGNIDYDAQCINLTAVDRSAPGPRLHGLIQLNGFEGRREEISIQTQVRDAGNAMVAQGSDMLMSTGQFEIPLTVYEFPFADSGYKVWLKPRGRLAKVITPTPFVSGTGELKNITTGAPTITYFDGGDIDDDNEVSILDYLTLSYFFGQQRVTNIPLWSTVDTAVGCRPMDADIDGDDEVSILDYIAMSTNYGLQGAP